MTKEKYLFVNDPLPIARPYSPWDIDCSKDDKKFAAKQEFKDDCDVNLIVERCIRTGSPLPDYSVPAAFADVSQFGDFGAAVRRMDAALEAFNALPAPIRTRFNNSPVQLVDFIQDVNNKDEAIKLGLISAPAPIPAPPLPLEPPPK